MGKLLLNVVLAAWRTHNKLTLGSYTLRNCCLLYTSQYLIASGRTFFGDMVYSDLHRMQIDFETVSYTHLLLGSLMAPAAPLASSHP